MKKTVLLVALCITGGVYAQERKRYTNFEDTVFTMKDVIVESEQVKKTQALKLDVPTKFMPQSTHVLPAKLLEERGIQNIQDATRFIPGVRVRSTYGAFQELTIRGFSSSLIALDGVRDERATITSYPVPDLSTVENIELVKGPSSVICGAGAVGGFLNISRKTAKAERTAEAKMSVGSWGYRQSFLGIGGKLAGPFNYYASINYSNTDGWRNVANKRLSVYANISGKLTEWDGIDIRGGFNNDDYATEAGLPKLMQYDIYDLNESVYLKKYDALPDLNKKSRYNNESDFMKNNGWNIMAQYAHTFNRDMKLTDKFSYMYDDINYFSTEGLSYLTSGTPLDGYNHYYLTRVNNQDVKTYICLDSVSLSSPLRFSHIAQMYSNQLELSGKVNTGFIKHNYLAGYSMYFLRRVSYSANVSGPGKGSHVAVNHPQSMGHMDYSFYRATLNRRYMHGLYIQDLMEFSDRLKVLLSVRYDTYKYRTAYTTDVDGRSYKEPDAGAFTGVATDAFTYRMGAVYLPVPSLSLYVSASSYFKPINTTYNDQTIYVNAHGNEFDPSSTGGEVFKPEEGNQFEFGARYELNDKLSANASVFYINKKNVVTSLGTKEIDNVDWKIQGQVGRMDSKGFDVDVTYTPIHGLMFTSGYSLTDAKVRKIAKNKYMSENSDNGNRFTYVPRNTFYALADYTLTKGRLKDLGFNLSLCYVDEQLINIADNVSYDSYWITDLGVSYKLRNNIRLSLMVNNLFNVDYCDSSLGMQMFPGTPRNYLLSATYSF